MHLLMKEKCSMPSRKRMEEVLEKHLGGVECFCCDENVAGFTAKRYRAEFKGEDVPPQLIITGCTVLGDYEISAMERSQMWDCENSEEILDACQYHVAATDLFAGAMPSYKERADLLMNFMEALVELYPECAAVQFQTSGKMFEREKILGHQIPKEERFIYFAVNARLFNVEGGTDLLLDTLGMSTLFLPDLQYHFIGIDPNLVVNHAYQMLLYLYENGAVIESGETVDGIREGELSDDVRWECHYESAMVQPTRDLLDIHMGEYAAGSRNYTGSKLEQG